MGNTVAIGIVFVNTIALLKINCKHFTKGDYTWLKWNSNGYLIANWNNMFCEGKKIFGVLPRNLSVRNGYILLGICCSVVILFGGLVVNRIDIIQSDKEI